MARPDGDLSAAPLTRGVVLRKAAAVYDLLSPATMLWREGRINRRAVELLQLRPGDRVLDVGCATGRVTLEVARHLDAACGGLAVGLDASPEMIRTARRKAPSGSCRFDLGVAEAVPYEDRSFDKAVSTFFFHHLNGQDKLACLREVRRVLTEDGLFVLADVDVPTNWLGRLCAACGQWLLKQPELDENIAGLLPSLFTEAGFTGVRRLAHDLGYVTTFVLRKNAPLERTCDA